MLMKEENKNVNSTNEISIVTWFFDIGRKDWKGFERDNNTYANYFKFWARLNNCLY